MNEGRGVGRRDVWRRNPWFWRAVIFMAALFALSSVPDHGPEAEGVGQVLMPPPAWHNFAHVPAYALLTWLCWQALVTAQWRGATALWTAVGIAFAYGVLDEVHQYFVPGRFLSGTDTALNAAGCLLAVVIIVVRGRIRGRSA
ncbi:MAG TPA: VanZ family protein [Candidatus Krumholzibacteria bacterium]|nr:VanZ family protein [Candidatus Krumholzibacteria bacterium]